ncbi:hypothetical protein EIL87_08885 [Saccharopolyspora rhizosphaerae]|uniref:Uncharacterized protein n=1 Tax=Saccharopolyspora rhizosphaerae TaxID=2492662 RepID=A0A3R8P7J1_9PSEU|nr:hypothetical protein [Saccharopolyspora rhizosphaerae]RRO18330.1 hypothetical protein EIL87_08885 [Saccharopolyspora rhizosphaerae]
MRQYPVHLLFHLLAIIAGAACGVAGALWWLDGDRNALHLASAALAVGVIVLLLQGFYISANQPRPVRRRPLPPAPPSHPRFQPVAERRNPTRPDLEPVAPPEVDSATVDQDTKSAAFDALNEHTKQG